MTSSPRSSKDSSPAASSPSASDVERLVKIALEEDLGAKGDLTSAAVVPARQAGHGIFLLKERGGGVVCGLDVAREVFRQVDPATRFVARARDGAWYPRGTVVAEVEGRARALLAGERVALNALQHLSGVATSTRRYVDRARKGGARILDTRKTLPGLRSLQKYAVRMGGGTNHRLGLDRMILLKSNHLRLAGRGAEAFRRALAASRRLSPPGQPIEVEVRSAREALAAAEAGARLLLLDNFTPGEVRRTVRDVRRRFGRAVAFEVSGGVTLRNVAAFSRAGADRISVGVLTHSAPALDLSMVLWPTGA